LGDVHTDVNQVVVLRFIIKKLGYGLLIAIGVITVIFFLFNILPGDPARMMLGQRADQSAVDAINRDLGRDRSLLKQYLMYLNDLSPISYHEEKETGHFLYLDPMKYEVFPLFHLSETKLFAAKLPYLRRSYQSRKNVSEIIAERLPATLVLAFTAMFIATLFGVLIGVLTAIYKGSWIDNSFLFVTVLGMSGPSFFVAILMAWIFGFLLSDLTGLHMTGSLYSIDDFGNGTYLDLKNLILPALTLGIRPLAVIVQLTRSTMLEVLSEDYVRTARAKGLSKTKVVLKHALRNALNPVVTAVSGWFASLMAGAVFVEMIFAWKGIGWEVVSALEKYDFPVVMGIVLVIALIFVLLNVVVDIIYSLLDPRIALT
jgi:peptide/nickel transport system permease protein